MPKHESRLQYLEMQLRAMLSQLDERAFLQAMWALNCLQGNAFEKADGLLANVPDSFVGAAISGPTSIYPWEIESLINEMFASPTSLYRHSGLTNWRFFAHLVNLLRQIDDAETTVRRPNISAFRELGRIAARQFEWQRGFTTVVAFIRAMMIYGQGYAAEFFESTYGISVPDIMLVGFTIRSLGLERHTVSKGDLTVAEIFGLSPGKLDRALALISCRIPEVRKRARDARLVPGALS